MDEIDTMKRSLRLKLAYLSQAGWKWKWHPLPGKARRDVSYKMVQMSPTKLRDDSILFDTTKLIRGSDPTPKVSLSKNIHL
jgi:hypothetical protein